MLMVRKTMLVMAIHPKLLTDSICQFFINYLTGPKINMEMQGNQNSKNNLKKVKKHTNKQTKTIGPHTSEFKATTQLQYLKLCGLRTDL